MNVPRQAEPQPLSWSIPLELTVRIGPGAGASLPVAVPVPAATEALAEPFRDENFSGRGGYDERFLGIDVPVPSVRDESVVSRLDDGSHLLPYEHFSVVMHRGRRLALFIAANTDANPVRKRPEPGRDYTRRGLTGLGRTTRRMVYRSAHPRRPPASGPVLHQGSRFV